MHPTGRPLVPSQHGAWGFLGLPVVLGLAAAGWSPWLAALIIAWVAAYPASWALTGMLTARRPARFHRAAAVWIPICLVSGTAVLVARPWLLWILAVYGVLFAVNLLQARARRERSVTNDLVLIAECALLIPVVAGVATGSSGFRPPLAQMTSTPVLVAVLLAALTLTGSTLHVKSLIRERANPSYTRASRLFAAAALVTVAVTCLITRQSLWLIVPFLLWAARARWLHNPTWRPARIGLVELAGLLAVALSALAFA